MSNALPFRSLSDAEFESFIKASYTMQISQNDIDKLSQLKFNPFRSNKNITLSDNNKELDTFFNTNTIVCDYFLPNDFKTHLEKFDSKTKFSMLHLNIKSISNKFDSSKQVIDTLNLHFQKIGLTETWLTDNNVDCFALDEYEYLSSNRKQKRGGGVGLYLSKQLEFKNRKDLDKNLDDVIETKFAEIVNNNGKNIIVGVIYRPIQFIHIFLLSTYY